MTVLRARLSRADALPWCGRNGLRLTRGPRRRLIYGRVGGGMRLAVKAYDPFRRQHAMSTELVYSVEKKDASNVLPFPVQTFQGLRLTTAFQPIFSVSHRSVVGFEALLRAFTSTGLAVSPAQAFGRIDGAAD